MKKNLQISLEDAKELLKTNPYLKESLEELFPELSSKVKDSWKYLDVLKGFYISSDSRVTQVTDYFTDENHKNIFATQSQALSSLAYSQLTQLMKDTGDCEGIDWDEKRQIHTIERFGNSLDKETRTLSYQPIAFKTKSIRDEFFEKHQELLKQYFQIQ